MQRCVPYPLAAFVAVACAAPDTSCPAVDQAYRTAATTLVREVLADAPRALDDVHAALLQVHAELDLGRQPDYRRIVSELQQRLGSKATRSLLAVALDTAALARFEMQGDAFHLLGYLANGWAYLDSAAVVIASTIDQEGYYSQFRVLMALSGGAEGLVGKRAPCLPGFRALLESLAGVPVDTDSIQTARFEATYPFITASAFVTLERLDRGWSTDQTGMAVRNWRWHVAASALDAELRERRSIRDAS